jgi:hypothetical protein
MISSSSIKIAIANHLKLIEIVTIPLLASSLPLIYQNKVNILTEFSFLLREHE